MFRIFKLRTQMFAGFAIVLSLLGVVAYSGYTGLRKVVEGVEKTETMNHLSYAIHQARLGEKDVMLRGDPRDIEYVTAILEEMLHQGEALQTDGFLTSRAAQGAQLLQRIREYAQAFADYVTLEQQKHDAMTIMQDNAHLAIERTHDFRDAQDSQLQAVRQKSSQFVTDKFAKADDAGTLVKHTLQSRLLRTSLANQYNQEKLDAWKAINQQILALTRDLRTRFAQKRNIQRANIILKRYQDYVDTSLLYFISESESDLKSMIAAEEIAMTQMEAIRADQKAQLAQALADTKRETLIKMGDVDSAYQIVFRLLEARQHEKEIIAGGDLDAANVVNAGVDHILLLAQNLRAQDRVDTQSLQLDEAITAVRTYHESFQRYVELLGHQGVAQERMVAAALAVQQICQESLTAQKADMEGQIVQARTLMLGVTIVATMVGLFIAGMITRGVTQPLGHLVDTANAVACGDFSREITIRQNNEIGILAEAFRKMKGTIGAVLKDMDELIQGVQKGKLAARANADAYAGDWRELIVGVNAVIEALVTPITDTATHLERIAKGDIPSQITEEAQGDFNEIKNNMNLLIGNIARILQETKTLNQAILNGKLDMRGNAASFSGDWQQLVLGMNAVIQAFIDPLSKTSQYLGWIAAGDVPKKITEEYKGDFKMIKNNLNTLIESFAEITRLAEEMAEGNLSIIINKRSEHDTLMQALQTMLVHVSAIVVTMQTAAGTVAISSQGMSANAEQLSQGSTEQAASAEEVSASMDQMAANIRQTADNAAQTETTSRKAAIDAQAAREAVEQTVAAMRQILKEITFVEEIARQTHILSLNATIEAVKAQEYGKGFGVVAAEVRNLAERSQTAAVAINTLANDSIVVAERAGSMLSALVPNIQDTAELVREISTASTEQNAGAVQINRAIQQLDSIIQQNAISSEQMAASAEALAIQAQQLQQTVAFFQVKTFPNETGKKQRQEAKEAFRVPTLEIKELPETTVGPETRNVGVLTTINTVSAE